VNSDTPEFDVEGGEDAVAQAAVDLTDLDVDAIIAERDSYLDSLQRLQADFANYRKRIERDQAQMVERATERLLEALLPISDSFELALTNLPHAGSVDPIDAAQLHKGVELVFAELVSVLERSGLERMVPDGETFDPHQHEAVLQVDAPEPLEHPVVLETMRTGYRLHGRVLRPAMVKVAR
jgi:molecular chaperone GrpE